MDAAEIDDRCQKFEDAWKVGERPQLETHLQDVAAEDRGVLLRELIQIELWWRKEEDPRPTRYEFDQRFSSDADAVESAFQEFHHYVTTESRIAETMAGEELLQAVQLLPAGKSSSTGPTTNRFQLQKQLGSGSYGVVWMAYDCQLKRMVALKVPHRGILSGIVKERFMRESQAAAKLSHDGIVPVYDVCLLADGLPMIVSRFIDGPSLAEFQKQQKVFESRDAAILCADLADALLHAHMEGIVHRDLKPANILLDVQNKTYITDFGLAKDLQNEESLSLEGDLIGTAAYMSPEQAAGRGNQADLRCDIYAVGAILYEMVTGERPFRGTLQALLQQVINDPPIPPQRLNASVAKDLQTIILKCMEKNPENRYRTAADLRDDLLRFVNNEPIKARPPTLLDRFIRWYPAHATEMLGTYYVIAPMTWVFFIAGGLLEVEDRTGLQLASPVFLPWALAWIGIGALILKKGFWFEIANIPVMILFMLLPIWLNDRAQSLALIFLISFFGVVLQFGAIFCRHALKNSKTVGNFSSRLSSAESGSRGRS